MRNYFITVRSKEAALAVDSNAVYIETLPATDVVHTYCCSPARIAGKLSEAYIYRVNVEKRSAAEKANGVVRCRAKEPKRYRTHIYIEMC